MTGAMSRLVKRIEGFGYGAGGSGRDVRLPPRAAVPDGLTGSRNDDRSVRGCVDGLALAAESTNGDCVRRGRSMFTSRGGGA
jgi:hypothetical protein